MRARVCMYMCVCVCMCVHIYYICDMVIFSVLHIYNIYFNICNHLGRIYDII